MRYAGYAFKIRSWSRTVFGHSWVGTLHRLNLVHDKTKNYKKFKHFHLSSFITPLQLLHWMVLSLPKGQTMARVWQSLIVAVP